MKRCFYLFKVSLEKNLKEQFRYKFNTFSNILILYILFMAMFTGIKGFGIQMGVSPINMGDTLEGFIIGYFLWTIMMMAYSNIAYSIVNDASRGTLEQLNMSHINLSFILTARSFANLLLDYLISIFLLFIIMNSTGHWININIFSILVPIFMGIFSILGIGLIFGGLALIFKQVQSLLNIVQYFLIALIMGNPSRLKASILPFRLAVEQVYMIVFKDYSLLDFSFLDYGMILGNSIFYFSIGLIVFNQCTKLAKSKGLLGQY